MTRAENYFRQHEILAPALLEFSNSSKYPLTDEEVAFINEITNRQR